MRRLHFALLLLCASCSNDAALSSDKKDAGRTTTKPDDDSGDDDGGTGAKSGGASKKGVKGSATTAIANGDTPATTLDGTEPGVAPTPGGDDTTQPAQGGETTQPAATQPATTAVDVVAQARADVQAVITGHEIPIYRCRYQPSGVPQHHYYTADPNCEGAAGMTLEGKVFTGFTTGNNGCGGNAAGIAQMYRAHGSLDPNRTYIRGGWTFYTLCMSEQPDYLNDGNFGTGWGYLSQIGGVNAQAYAQVINELGLVPLYRTTATTSAGKYFFYSKGQGEGGAAGFSNEIPVGFVKP
jgi:hypothetical protein